VNFDRYLHLKQLAHSVESWEEFIAELGKLSPEERPYIKEGYKWFYERYKEIKQNGFSRRV
jgi:hypothetical protein